MATVPPSPPPSPPNPPGRRVLVTGATGFVGTRLLPRLVEAGHQPVGASRHPHGGNGAGNGGGSAREGKVSWVQLDVDRPETLRPALEGMDAAYYLIHGMRAEGDYLTREVAAARAFARAAAEAGLRRIVYLGGVLPRGPRSRHLESRFRVGEALREGKVPTVELRAGMIIGAGSESWRIVRDLSVRLPAMVLPRWLKSRSAPVAVGDVLGALVGALTLPEGEDGIYELPGPEVMSAEEMLRRTARLRGTRPWVVHVPFVSPSLSSHWIRWVTRGDARIARELVEGLRSDLLPQGPLFWPKLGADFRPVPFDDAAREALREEARSMGLSQWLLEELTTTVARKAPLPG